MKQIKRTAVFLCCVAGLSLTGRAVQYEPPLNIIFLIHIEPLPDTTNYPTRLACLQWLEQFSQTSAFPFKMTILVNGDFAEYALYRGDQAYFAQLQAEGHQLGVHAHPRLRLGPLNWIDVGEATYRYGTPFYDPDTTVLIWSEATTWANALVGGPTQVMCAFPFLCSTEGQLLYQFGFLADPGNRSEKGLDYFGHLVRHPFRPAAYDRLGHELEEDPVSPFIYIDHYAQIGNENAHGYNCTEPAMEQALDQCYQEWLSAEMAQGDSLDYKVWTFGFLTHDWLFSPYYQDQIATFIDYINEHYVGHYTPRGNLIARFSTVETVREEYLNWETSHPGESSFSYVHPFPQIPLVNEVMIIPEDSAAAGEWIELYNPTDQGINISGYRFSSGLLIDSNLWRFPASSWLGAREYLVVAHDGAVFQTQYGFLPDFEVTGNTAARLMLVFGNYELNDDHGGCVLSNTNPIPANTNTAITDGLSWGGDYVAGFTLPQPQAGCTYGRNDNSLDTGFAEDWSCNGGALQPTPGAANAPASLLPTIPVAVPATDLSLRIIPNPFNRSTRLDIQLPQNSSLTLDVYDLAGRKVYTQSLPNAGTSSQVLILEGRSLSSGIYLVLVHTETAFTAKKALLLK